MDKHYKKLFITICESMEATAENAMSQSKSKNNFQDYKTAQEMRSRYSRIHDLLTSKKIDYTPTKEDFNAISIGAVLIIKQIEKQLSERQLALKGYKEDLLPKLQEVLKCETNDEIKGKIDDIFKTNDWLLFKSMI